MCKLYYIRKRKRTTCTYAAAGPEQIHILEDVGNVSEELKEFIFNQKDLNELKKMLKLAGSSKSVDEFEEKAGILSGSKK